MVLVGYSLVLLLLGFVLGIAVPKARFWGWVDLVYYPLAIFGVLLLYFEGETTRFIVAKEEGQAELASELRAIEKIRPSADIYFSSKNLIRSGGEWLKLISRMDAVCDATAGSRPACKVAGDFAPITIPAERLLLGYEGPKDIGDICKAASEVFTRLSEDTSLSRFLMVPLAGHFFRGLEKDFFDTDYDRVQTYINELNPKLENEIEMMIGYLSLNASEEDWMKPIYIEEAKYGLMVMNAFEVCLRAPEAIRSGEYSAWVEKSEAKQNEIQFHEEELRDLRSSTRNISSVTKLRVSFWPFVIVFALALKFAKGVAHIKKTRTILAKEN